MGSGGKGASAGSQVRDYYASFAGVICYGPVDELVSVVIDGKVAWQPGTPIQRATSANPFVFDVDGWGRIHFYWGTETQILTDPVLTKPGRDHPPYRRRALAVFEKFLCGRERTSVPDVSFVLRRKPKQSVIAGPADALDSDGQANPVAAVAEMLTDGVIGLNFPSTALEALSFGDAAEDLQASSSREYLTIESASSTKIRTLLGQVNGYADTYFRVNSAGQIAAGRFSRDGDTAGLPTFSRDDLASGSEPAYSIRSLSEADGRITLKFINRLRAYEDDIATFNNGLRRELVGKEDPAEVDRKWIRRPGQAAWAAAQIGAREGLSWHKFELVLREDRADHLGPGDRLIFQDDLFEMTFLARVVSRSGDSDIGGPVRLELETERVIGDVAGTGTGDLNSGNDDEIIADCPLWRPLKATASLLEANNENSGSAIKLFVLAGKHQGSSSGYNVYFRKQNATQFQFIGNSRSWAVPMVSVGWPGPTSSSPNLDTTGNIKIAINNYPQPNEYIGFDEIQSAPSQDEIEDDMWLAIWVDKDVFGGNPRIYEIMTIVGLFPDSPGTYVLHAKRARLGTSKRTWSGVYEVYLINRYDLEFFTHLSLPAIASSSTQADRTITCDIAPYSPYQTTPVGSNVRTLEVTS